MMYAAVTLAILVLAYLHLGPAAFGLLLGVLVASGVLWIFWRTIND